MRKLHCGPLLHAAMMIASFASCALAAADSPKDVYLNYHDTLLKASDMKELQPFYAKEISDRISKGSKQQALGTLRMQKSMIPTDLKVDSEKVNGNEANLTISGVLSPPVKAGATASKNPKHVHKMHTVGTITMVKESGAWKIKHQDWNAGNDNFPMPTSSTVNDKIQMPK
jgi:hypothetical protein